MLCDDPRLIACWRMYVSGSSSRGPNAKLVKPWTVDPVMRRLQKVPVRKAVQKPTQTEMLWLGRMLSKYRARSGPVLFSIRSMRDCGKSAAGAKQSGEHALRRDLRLNTFIEFNLFFLDPYVGADDACLSCVDALQRKAVSLSKSEGGDRSGYLCLVCGCVSEGVRSFPCRSQQTSWSQSQRCHDCLLVGAGGVVIV